MLIVSCILSLSGSVTFSPHHGEREVSLNVGEILISFPTPKTLGAGTVNLTGESSKVLRLPYTVQRQFFTLDRSRDQSKYISHEINISTIGLQNEVLFEGAGELTEKQIGVRQSDNVMWIQFIHRLRPEAVYTVNFDPHIVEPPENIPSLSFSTRGYDSTRRATTWSFQCDPWKFRPLNLASDYVELGAWDVCPEERRSNSGCGDFDNDPRFSTCTSVVKMGSCDDHPFHRAFPDLWPKVFKQRQVFTHHMPAEVFERGVHICFNVPIPAADRMADLRMSEFSLPPTEGNHRDNWGKHGEYVYIPDERWLHNAEHGDAVFLYDPCLASDELCMIRDYATGVPDDGGGPFRWVLSPYVHGQRGTIAPPGTQNAKLLDTPMMHLRLWVSTYSNVLGLLCFDGDTISWFLDRHYREAYEDLAMEGFYSYLHKQDSACPAHSIKQLSAFYELHVIIPVGIIALSLTLFMNHKGAVSAIL